MAQTRSRPDGTRPKFTRVTNACRPCQKNKKKCGKTFPCQTCVARNISHQCRAAGSDQPYRSFESYYSSKRQRSWSTDQSPENCQIANIPSELTARAEKHQSPTSRSVPRKYHEMFRSSIPMARSLLGEFKAEGLPSARGLSRGRAYYEEIIMARLTLHTAGSDEFRLDDQSLKSLNAMLQDVQDRNPSQSRIEFGADDLYRSIPDVLVSATQSNQTQRLKCSINETDLSSDHTLYSTPGKRPRFNPEYLDDNAPNGIHIPESGKPSLSDEEKQSDTKDLSTWTQHIYDSGSLYLDISNYADSGISSGGTSFSESSENVISGVSQPAEFSLQYSPFPTSMESQMIPQQYTPSVSSQHQPYHLYETLATTPIHYSTTAAPMFPQTYPTAQTPVQHSAAQQIVLPSQSRQDFQTITTTETVPSQTYAMVKATSYPQVTMDYPAIIDSFAPSSVHGIAPATSQADYWGTKSHVTPGFEYKASDSQAFGPVHAFHSGLREIPNDARPVVQQRSQSYESGGRHSQLISKPSAGWDMPVSLYNVL